MKKNKPTFVVIATVAITFFVSNYTSSQSPACDNCVNTLSGCVASKGGAMGMVAIAPSNLDGGGCTRSAPFVVSGVAVTGCVNAYNNTVVNLGCTCYPFAIEAPSSLRVKSGKVGSRTRRG